MNCNDNQKLIGVIHVPSKEKYMCLSIRQHYVSMQFREMGATKEQADNLAKQTVK